MRRCRLGCWISVLFLVFMLIGFFPGTSTAAAKSEAFRSVDRLSVPKTRIFLPVILKDPAPINPVQPSHETFSIDWSGGNIQALGGRVSLSFPQGAVNYPNCTLHVESPDQNALWPEFNFYILCQVNPGEDPYNFYKFNFLVTISIDYSQLPSAFLDESRLIISSGSVSTALEQAPATENSGILSSNLPISNIVVDTANKVVSGQTIEAGPLHLSRGYTITDLAAGPIGTAYVAASPIVYQAGASGGLTTFADLTDSAPAQGLLKGFSRLAADPVGGRVFLILSSQTVGASQKVATAAGSGLNVLYAVPAGEEIWNLTYEPQGDLLYLSMSRKIDSWFGCPVRELWIRVLQAANGAVVGDLNTGRGGIGVLEGMAVDSEGRLLAALPVKSCGSSDYSGASLLTAEGTNPLDHLSFEYPGFRGLGFLAAGANGRTYLSNSTGDTVSVVAGPLSDVVGSIPVTRPGPLAVSGGILFVLSQGELTTRSAESFNEIAPEVQLTPAGTLSGSNLDIAAKASGFSNIPAHNVLYYNGSRFLMDPLEEESFTGSESVLHYTISIPQPDPSAYQPLTEQYGSLEFKINGVSCASQQVKAPAVPYLEFALDSTGAGLTVAPGQWVALSHYQGYSLSSDEGLFPAAIRYGDSIRVFYQFTTPGEYHFTITGEGTNPTLKHATVTVNAYGAPASAVKTIDPAKGGVLWAGVAALEIPPGALPANPGGYQVLFYSQANTFPVRDSVSDKSLAYYFKFTPEVTLLNQDILVHMPQGSGGANPVMAFYDPNIQDAFPIEYGPDSTMAGYITLKLPAGTYPLSASLQTEAPLLRAVNLKAPASPSWLRRGLNWLGTTGVWHAVGLPNDRLETSHFVILFNSTDCSPAYAGNLLDALEEGYSHFQSLGAVMPATAVYVKVAPWIAGKSTPGVTPGIGSLFNFYIFINNALTLEYLQDTAVHEFMHVLQKTNASPAGRYLNPLWWEEATAIWAQYEVYPSHTGYYTKDIHPAYGEEWLRKGYANWNSMEPEEMNAAMALAVYLQQNYGASAVLETFWNMSDDLTGPLTAIQTVTGKPIADFYKEFVQAYWSKSFEPVKSWNWTSRTGPVVMNQPVNTVFQSTVPALSSGLVTIQAATSGLPPSFTDPLAMGSTARIAGTCLGKLFYYYDAGKKIINGLKFEGASNPPYDALLHNHRLGDYPEAAPLHLLYIDNRYGYTDDCTPALTLEQPTITGVSPSSVQINTSNPITVTGGGFGTTPGTILIGGQNPPVGSWLPGRVTFNWNSGSITPGWVTVTIINSKGAISNRSVQINITP